MWLYAVYLMTSTRCGLSAKQLERELGVIFKTAHRIFKMIHIRLITQDDEPLDGEIEMGETYDGGKPVCPTRRAKSEGRAPRALPSSDSATRPQAGSDTSVCHPK